MEAKKDSTSTSRYTSHMDTHGHSQCLFAHGCEVSFHMDAVTSSCTTSSTWTMKKIFPLLPSYTNTWTLMVIVSVSFHMDAKSQFTWTQSYHHTEHHPHGRLTKLYSTPSWSVSHFTSTQRYTAHVLMKEDWKSRPPIDRPIDRMLLLSPADKLVSHHVLAITSVLRCKKGIPLQGLCFMVRYHTIILCTSI